MSKREKVIVALTLLVALYGAYNFIFSSTESKDRPTVVSKQELNRFITDTTAGLARSMLNKEDRTILAKAATEWNADPFISTMARLTPEQKIVHRQAPQRTVDATYSGYLKIGDRFLAIINGTEYEVGDQLEPGGYTIRRISPEKIILREEGKPGMIFLPLEDETSPTG